MITINFEKLNELLKEKFIRQGFVCLGLSGINTDSNKDRYYLVSINKEAVSFVKNYGSISETLTELTDRYNFKLYLDEIDGFLNQ